MRLDKINGTWAFPSDKKLWVGGQLTGVLIFFLKDQQGNKYKTQCDFVILKQQLGA